MNMRNVFSVVLLVALFAVTVSAAYTPPLPGSFPDSGFSITQLTQQPDRIYPGDHVQLKFSIKNTASAATNVRALVLVPFLSEQQSYVLGDMAVGQESSVLAGFEVPNTTKAGDYTIFVYVIDQRGNRNQVGEMTLIVNEPSLANALFATVTSTEDLYSGGTAEIDMVVKNIGVLPAEDVVAQVQFSSGSSIYALASDRVYVSEIAPGGNATVHFTIGASSSAVAGYYPLSIQLTYKVDKAEQPKVNQSVSLRVLSKASVLITSDRSTATSGASAGLLVTIANTGDTAIRSVYASAASKDFSFVGASDKFIGTLNLDDSATLSLNLIPLNGANGERTVQVSVTYKDPLNIERTQVETITVDGTGASLNGTFGTSASQRFGRTSQQFTILGLDPWLLAGIIIVAIGAFFGYKWVKRREK